ncbi:MAG: transporter [Calditrichaeota bacterium]|nr:transporter [Calditrichota bacterium]
MKLLALLLGLAVSLSAQYDSGRLDTHAPINVMGDHVHKTGEWMFSYRLMLMNMNKTYNGNKELSQSDYFNSSTYMVFPIEMPMTMHMFGVMYAPSDDVTLLAMANVLTLSMDHISRTNVAFTSESGGLGDISLGAIFRLMDGDDHRLVGNIQLILPSGSIEQKDATPMSAGVDVILPYPMQLGAGSFGAKLSATYMKQMTCGSIGAQVAGQSYFGKNDRDYQLGSRFDFTVWYAHLISPEVSVSGRTIYQSVGKIDGADAALNAGMVHTADAALKGGSAVSMGLGCITYPIRHLRVSYEMVIGLFRDLNGPQLNSNHNHTIALQYSF